MENGSSTDPITQTCKPAKQVPGMIGSSLVDFLLHLVFFRVFCGWQSGHNIDKVKEAGLELEAAETISTPGVKQYPLTIECRVLYSQDQDLSKIPVDIREKMYPQDVDGSYPMANRDFHTMYVGEIVDAYIIK